MKKNALIILAVFFNLNLQAQYFNMLSKYENLDDFLIVDSASFRYTYKLIYLKDTLKFNEKSEDIQVLLLGKNISKYYSQYALDYNSFLKSYIKTHDNYPNNPNKGAWTYELFKNYPLGKSTVADIASMLSGNFIYEEDPAIFDWKISSEIQKILSYSCQKAYMSFRGRNYEAWFTREIPIFNGPWKFGGLPGLIMKIADSKNNFIFECIGMEVLKEKEPIKLYKIPYSKVKKSELDKLYRRFHNDFKTYQNMLGIKVEIHSAKNKPQNSAFKIPYNPIELE